MFFFYFRCDDISKRIESLWKNQKWTQEQSCGTNRWMSHHLSDCALFYFVCLSFGVHVYTDDVIWMTKRKLPFCSSTLCNYFIYLWYKGKKSGNLRMCVKKAIAKITMKDDKCVALPFWISIPLVVTIKRFERCFKRSLFTIFLQFVSLSMIEL